MIDSLYLGPSYDLSHIKGEKVNTMHVAKLIQERNVVAIFQGRSEADLEHWEIDLSCMIRQIQTVKIESTE